MEQRIPVLDSCILLSNPDLVGYEGRLVYIPLAVYRELDRQKTYEGLVGFKARAVNRRLRFPVGSESFVYYHEEESNIRVLVPNDELEARINPSLEEPKADDSFINMAILEEGTNFVLHTADKSLAYLAKLQHKQVEFIADANRAFLENIYSGHREVWVTDAEYNDLSLIDTSSFYPNEYLLIRTHTGFRLGKVKGSRVVPVVKDKKLYGVAPKNLEQRFLFDAILDDDVKVIILSGSAGTGKTLVSLAGGLNGIESGQYSQLILAKSLASLNKQEETGYLPGSLLDKLIPQFANYTSNFEVLLGGNGRAMRKDGILLSVGESQINYLIDKGELALMSLDSVLGASFHKKFIIIDEAQSLDYKTLRCILTRISDDCKLILLGDILQETSAMSSPDKSALFIANRFLREAKAVATLSLSKVERGSACQEISTILDQIG